MAPEFEVKDGAEDGDKDKPVEAGPVVAADAAATAAEEAEATMLVVSATAEFIWPCTEVMSDSMLLLADPTAVAATLFKLLNSLCKSLVAVER